MLDLYCESSKGLRFGDIPLARANTTEICVSSSFNGCWVLNAVPINAFAYDVHTHLPRLFTELNCVDRPPPVWFELRVSRYIIEAKTRSQRRCLLKGHSQKECDILLKVSI